MKNSGIKTLVLAVCIVLFPLLFFSQSISMSSDSEIVQTDAIFGFVLTAEGSFDSIEEPDFNGFSVENRSQSQSNSINIINGRIDKKRSVTYTYALRAEKAGVFEIGPAILKAGGKRIKSNKVTITVTGSGSTSGQAGQQKNPVGNDEDDTDTAANNEDYYKNRANSLMSPLSSWEKKTPNTFIRAIVDPADGAYKGEPVIVSYYFYTKPGMVNDVNFYKLPVFDNCWKEEKSASRLEFKRVSIDGTVYDYAHIKTYLLIPDGTSDVLKGTQMIMDVTTGSFFQARKTTISSVGIEIPLSEIPEIKDHRNGIYGDFTLTADKGSVTLDKNNVLETLSFSLSGCGNFPAAEVVLEDNPDLRIFDPEIDSKAEITPKGYCGTKKYKFMAKGLKRTETSIKIKPIDVFSRGNGWKTLSLPDIKADIKESQVNDEDKDQEAHSFELLKELPQNVRKYEMVPLTEKTWFVILMALPLAAMLISFSVWLSACLKSKRQFSLNAKREKWEKKILSSADHAELLNNFYDALADIYSIVLKGERISSVKQKYEGKLDDITDFIRKLEQAGYSGRNGADIAEFRAEAMKLLKPRGGK